jgi:pimeloyl-ACP methyl ester carboxylesterase
LSPPPEIPGVLVIGERSTSDGWLALSHATGFCKEVWHPVVEELAVMGSRRSIVAWDAPGHGDADPFVPPADWWEFARHSLAVLGPCDGPITGVGHSMGGATLMMAELLKPGSFERLIVIEPVIFPPPFERTEQLPLAEGALRRRDGFSSLEDALDNYRNKEPFLSWDPRALDAYVHGGLARRDGAWWLKCGPRVEADVYRAAMAHGLYGRLQELALPVLVIAGEHSNAFSESFVAELTQRIPGAGYVVLPGVSHFVPMERPDLVASEIVSFLGS